MADIWKVKCISTDFSSTPVYTFPMRVNDLLFIHYVAVRGKEEGAVQRFLNKRRIEAIKNFILQGNIFFNTFILNWTNENNSPKIYKKNGTIEIPIIASAAQVIDGQHRLAGLVS